MPSIAHVPPLIDRLSSTQLSRRIAVAGLCGDAATDDWFPAEEPAAGDPGARAAYEQVARDACAGCETRAECLILALRDEARHGVKRHGIWGGTAPWERAALTRRLRNRARGYRRVSEAVAS